MKKSIIAVVALVVVCLLSFGAYSFGHDKGYSEGYHNGHDVGYADARKDIVPAKTYLVEYNDLQNKYNGVVSDYNNLLNQAAQYINANAYKPVHCTSNGVGTYVYTNCY